MRLLLVEDDTMIGEGARKGLRQDGFVVDWVKDGQAAELALRTETYDMLLLDLGLPKRDGIDVLKALRARGDMLPVLIITARDAVADRVKGLDSGADDYVVKPFDLDELSARIRALLRRRSGRAESVIEHLGLKLDPASHLASFNGEPLALSSREFGILMVLLDHPGAILSRAQLEERLYGMDEAVESNAIEVHIHSLRKKIGHEFIRTVRGIGYMVPKRQ